MSQIIRVFAPAKINLFLHITGKRADGYHELSSLVTFSDNFGDEIIIEKSDQYSLALSAESPINVGIEDNLITKAAYALAKLLNKSPQVKITLKKHIPVGAGLGGGSSDAAHTIRGLLKFWNVPEPENLPRLLLDLGADVPVCYHAKTCLMRGIGEKIETYPFALPKHKLSIITSRTSLLTKDVFAQFSGRFDRDLTVSDIPKWDNAIDMIAWLKGQTNNSLQDPAIRLMPALKEQLNFQNENALVRMSGSGPTIFKLEA